MKKGSFYLTGKAIDCRGLSDLGDAGKEVFRALKVACYELDNLEHTGWDKVVLGDAMFLSVCMLEKTLMLNNYELSYFHPSHVLGQDAIDAAMDGATIVFDGDSMPKSIDLKLYEYGNGEVIAYKLLDEKQPSIESRILAEKTGSKHDQGKPLYNLIPVHAEAELVDVLTFGATKYAPNQWRNVPNAKERYTAAAMRHLAAYRMGESHDTESGKHHLAHAMCCLSFIIELDLEDNQ